MEKSAVLSAGLASRSPFGGPCRSRRGEGGGGGGGTRWGWYAGQVQARVEDALRKNPHTRSAAFSSRDPDVPGVIGESIKAKVKLGPTKFYRPKLTVNCEEPMECSWTSFAARPGAVSALPGILSTSNA
jgi:hypothetical protein